MICPKCGSNHIAASTVTETTSKTKGFGCIKACLGYLLFSVPGILCGMCGMGKGKTTTKTRMNYTCQNCGYRF